MQLTEGTGRSPTTADREIGSRIRAGRVALGLTQDALAVLVGVSYQQIQKYERGANRVSAGRLAQIATALSTTTAHLTGDLEGAEVGERQELVQALLMPGAIDLIQAWRNLPAPVRPHLMALALVLAELG